MKNKTTKNTKKVNKPSKNWHIWTDQQIEYLCCLKTKTTLSYQKISEIFAVCLRVQIAPDILRYKCNVLKGSLAPSQEKRRVSDFGGDNAWTKFANLLESSPEVQAVYRDCQIHEPCPGKHDSMALLPGSRPSPGPSPYTPTRRPARRSTTAASEQSFSSLENRSSSSTEVEVTPKPGPRASDRLYLPPTPNKDPAPQVESPDFIPYRWSYFETVYLCVLSIHARLSSKEIASVLNEKNGSAVNEEDVELKIDELSGEEYGIWEAWGAKESDHSEVEAALKSLGLKLKE